MRYTKDFDLLDNLLDDNSHSSQNIYWATHIG